ncbi:uncharacterized protein PgNI_12320, partial [Pyricularia grisea]|uniref:Uncharacterized protein n=1 Tax=Pyricularia grisea TaxID=148305 RepID=A0A6P8AMR9_PYRGI
DNNRVSCRYRTFEAVEQVKAYLIHAGCFCLICRTACRHR